VVDTAVGDVPLLAKKAWGALLSANDPPVLFRYGGTITWIEHDDNGIPVPCEVNQDRLRHRLARVAFWVRTRKKQSGKASKVPVPPPAYIVRDLLASPDPPLPVLNGITEVPVFAPDCSLHTRPGYHSASGLYYDPPPGFFLSTVPENPDQSDLDKARQLILGELLCDFPFVSDGDKAAAVALLLLPFVRILIPGPTPLHLIEAPSPGTGKTFLADALTIPSTGRIIEKMTEGNQEEEWRKRITAKLCRAPGVVVIDNIRRRLESSALSAAITTLVWEDRILGKSETVRLPVRCAWVGTGNNPMLSNEIARRTVRIRIDAKVDRPWEREGFKHPDLIDWAVKHRCELVWAALTIGRCWIAAGRPEPLFQTTLGMFEDWAKVIGGILEVADIPGFLGNLDDLYEQADEETAVWREFVESWWATYGDKPVKVADLWRLVTGANGGDFIALPLGDKSEHSQKIILGRLLSERRDRQFGPFRIMRGGKSNQARLWRLLREGRTTTE
jgi:hypothetical protein